MRTFLQIPELRTHLKAAREEGLTIGFVPTMGALHEGHLSLIRRAVTECERSVVSIFVNPTQFGAGEDLARYPRDLASDSRMCQEEGVDALFAPSVEQMYPDCAEGEELRPSTTVQVCGLTETLEGAARPGHFTGVATVCAKLFQIVQPHRAYFGQKDYQQLLVIQRMVADLNMPVSIVPAPTVREPDGLALSSRNAYLSEQERARAVALPRALEEAVRRYEAGERDADALRKIVRETLEAEVGIEVDYAEVADMHTLQPLSRLTTPAVALAAIRVGKTRLIDNMLLGAALNQHAHRAA